LKARVFVTLKPSVFDPQGRAIVEALHSLGYGQATDVRQGKYFVLDLDVANAADAEKMAKEISDKVLANPVIESFEISVDGHVDKKDAK
jgi:phosphoribosylformylglycinamidine synthase PurS subunit